MATACTTFGHPLELLKIVPSHNMWRPETVVRARTTRWGQSAFLLSLVFSPWIHMIPLFFPCNAICCLRYLLSNLSLTLKSCSPQLTKEIPAPAQCPMKSLWWNSGSNHHNLLPWYLFNKYFLFYHTNKSKNTWVNNTWDINELW